jgi:uncharacterized membrane protein
MRSTLHALLLAWIVCVLVVSPSAAQEPRVHAVLFYSPNCGHCQQLIQNDLPPLIEHYGAQLEILAIDVTHPVGQELYTSAIERFAIPEARRGVPAMIIGEVVLVGGFEIPEQFPVLVDAGLASGGLDWPDIPGLQDTLAQMQPEGSPTPEASAAAAGGTPAVISPPTPIPDQGPPPTASILVRDPTGLTLAVIVLLALLASLPVAWWAYRQARASTAVPGKIRYLFPALAVAGSLVALYMLSVETSGALAVCGPIGDCNAVQQSAYARLFGFVPIAALGLLLQVSLLVLYIVCSASAGRAGRIAAVLLLGLSVSAVLFSVYLTYLEIFVIGAVCAWCLTSAVIVAAEAWLAARIAGWRLPAAATPPASP